MKWYIKLLVSDHVFCYYSIDNVSYEKSTKIANKKREIYDHHPKQFMFSDLVLEFQLALFFFGGQVSLIITAGLNKAFQL